MRALVRISPRMSRRMIGTAVMAGTLALAPLSAPVASGTTTLAGASAEECVDGTEAADDHGLSGARKARGADGHAHEPNEVSAAKAAAMDADFQKKLSAARAENRLSGSADRAAPVRRASSPRPRSTTR